MWGIIFEGLLHLLPPKAQLALLASFALFVAVLFLLTRA
jgi:hypothetical protein